MHTLMHKESLADKILMNVSSLLYGYKIYYDDKLVFSVSDKERVYFFSLSENLLELNAYNKRNHNYCYWIG